MILEESMDLTLALSEVTFFNVNSDVVDNVYAAIYPAPNQLGKILKPLALSKPPFDCEEILSKAHVTVIYSKEAGVNTDLLVRESIIQQETYRARVDGVQYWEGHDKVGYVVLKLHSDDANALNKALIDCGAKHSFDEYAAHMTVCNKAGAKTAELESWLEAFNEYLSENTIVIEFDRLVLEDLRD